MSPFSRSPDDSILVNKLTVKDATHLVKVEGGTLSPLQIIFRAGAIILVAAFTARAILVGQASAWHLFLPILGEYLVLLLSLPILKLFLKDPDVERGARQSLLLLFVGLIALSVWIGYRAFDEHVALWTQAAEEFSSFGNWITSHQMHWPILGAMIAMLVAIPGRVAAFRRHGPPFVGISLGCAMRIVVPLLGCFLLPLVASGAFPLVWVIWAILLLAEMGGLAMHWDLQWRLAKRGITV